MNKPNLKDYKEYNCWYDDTLVWDQYGYWHENTSANGPAWFTPAFIKESKQIAKSLIESDIQLWYKTKKEKNGKWSAEWITYDKANKYIYFQCGVSECTSESRAEDYVRDRHSTHKRLYGGVIDAMLVYKRTGVACLPDWNTNKSDSFGYKDGEKNEVPRASEVRKKKVLIA